MMKALNEINNFAFGFNIQWRGRSQAASVSSDVPKVKRVQKKVSKDERRAMMEAFVNNYRVTHNGKFPTVTDALKHVGGSFYVARKVLQELQYKSKILSSAGTNEKNLVVGVIEKNKVTVDVESQNGLHSIVAQDMEIVDTSGNHLEAEGGPSCSAVSGRALFDEVTKPVAYGGQSGSEDGKKEAVGDSYFVASEGPILKQETEEVSCSRLANADEKEEQIQSDNLLDLGGVKQEEKSYKGPSEPEQNAADISSGEAKDIEVLKKSTIWGNLKSFADSIISVWKKL
ncbi:uncharacterized protein LOC123196143 isoform X2 [Mangifera indica]|uniref:uncharacterized protein LOC123196143 isoform X2 n=1 Tax=Mangifera indica TaxID=29780 RepID=UPI001CFBEF95|nr:uncharacterized protein LOC123196143 isoform X2 [Mangifera indica]